MTFTTFHKGERKVDSPGPAAYNVPAPFGEGPKYTLKGRYKEKDAEIEPSMIKMPSTLVIRDTTFGYRPKERPIEITPGPDAVAPRFGSEGKKYSFRFKYEDPPNTNPGPAEYTISREFPGPKQTISEGKRSDIVDRNFMVPPGVYDIPSDFEKHKSLTIGSYVPIPQPERNGPGPAKYIAKTHIGYDTPKYTMPKGPRDTPPNRNPGPADYQRIRPLTSQSRVSTSIKNRTNIFPETDPHNEPYYDYMGSTFTPRKVSFGKRPKTSYKTIGPGPKYINKKPAIESRPAHIKSKYYFKNPMDDNPSPADYYSTEKVPRQAPFVGFYGPNDRCPVDLEKEKEKPGPGYYEEKDKFYEFKRGYYFTSRKMDDFIPDTDGGYVAQFSTLGGPKYTIGSRDAF